LSFIWNYFDEQSRAYSWLLRFENIGIEEKFQEGAMRALWERLNHQRWKKSNEDEREYVLQAFQGDVEMPDVSDDESEPEEIGEDSKGSLN
jgi:VID27 PH-like domain